MQNKNSLEHKPQSDKWAFDEKVTQVFDDMLERSIPNFNDMRDLTNRLINHSAKSNTNILDLGCSTGGAIKNSVDKLKDNHFICLEVSDPMRKQAVENFKDNENVTVQSNDIVSNFPSIDNVSVITSILTIQFTPIEHRQNILKSIYSTLNDGGTFLFVEKILGTNADMDNLLVNTYYDIKMNNGYTQENIKIKRKSLEGVLVPVQHSWNIEMLKNAGFKEIECYWRYLNFVGYIAKK